MKKTLYCSRSVENPDDIINWANSQKIPNIIHPDELHVTVAYSSTPVNFNKFKPKDNFVYLPPAKRKITKFGTSVVLLLDSKYLDDRWKYFIDNGCSWDFSTYNPHVSVSYQDDDIDVSKIKPYDGKIIFGEEKICEVNKNFAETSKKLNESLFHSISDNEDDLYQVLKNTYQEVFSDLNKIFKR